MGIEARPNAPQPIFFRVSLEPSGVARTTSPAARPTAANHADGWHNPAMTIARAATMNLPLDARRIAATMKKSATDIGKMAKLYTAPGNSPKIKRTTRERLGERSRHHPNHPKNIIPAEASHETNVALQR